VLSRRITKWTWTSACLAAVALVLVGTGVRPSNAAPPATTIYVYLPTTVRPPMLQKALSEALPGTTVMVFRHLRDFETSVAERPPDLVITRRPMLDHHAGWTQVMQGLAHHREDETCALVSVGQPTTPADAAIAGIGVVDLLGKKDMPALVATWLGIPTLPKLVRVAQPDDLLPLLELGVAKAVLMPVRGVPALREKSTLDLRVVELKDSRLGLPVLATLSTTPAAAALQRKLADLPPQVQSMLGVDEWRRP
jgi:hypothetical protein